MSIKLGVEAGARIDAVAKEMILLAEKNQDTVCAVFNGILLEAKDGDSAEDIVKYYHNEAETLAEVYRNTPEGKAVAEKREERIGTNKPGKDILKASRTTAIKPMLIPVLHKFAAEWKKDFDKEIQNEIH